ncbi:MAG TPA: DUF1232 domain-containing protein [Thermodesulfobacteriota bacterium]|nr:DUF1232 domain-containing protein [Thermodesulfobacteriota bacterium]
MKLLSKTKTVYHRVIINGLLVYRIFVNPKTPWYVRILFLIPIAYVFIPTDFISDMIPILGQLDDLAVLR